MLLIRDDKPFKIALGHLSKRLAFELAKLHHVAYITHRGIAFALGFVVDCALDALTALGLTGFVGFLFLKSTARSGSPVASVSASATNISRG